MTLRAVVVEDEALARQTLREMIDEVEWMQHVGEAGDGASAIDLINRSRPDIVFLDIEIPTLTGLEVLERIDHDPAVIFTTAYDRYAVTAFELEALDFLLKPFGKERFNSVVERARKSLTAGEPSGTLERAREAVAAPRLSRIFVRERGRILPVAVSEIERLEAEDDYVAVHSRGRRYLVYLTLAEFEARLDPDKFLRVHRSHVVHIEHVAAMVPYDGTRLQIEMRDGTKILASRERSKRLRHLVI